MFSGCASVRPSPFLFSRYLLNPLMQFNQIWQMYTIGHGDHLIKFWASNVQGQGHQRSKKGTKLQLFSCAGIINNIFMFDEG